MIGARYLPAVGEVTNSEFVDLVRAVLGLSPLAEETWSHGRCECGGKRRSNGALCVECQGAASARGRCV